MHAQDLVARVVRGDNSDVVRGSIGVVPGELDVRALQTRRSGTEGWPWQKKGAYGGDLGRGLDGELGKSSLDGERGEESDGKESGVHR